MAADHSQAPLERTRLQAGTQLNGIYVIDSLLATGGMGEVYRGHSIQTGDKVAIKVIRSDLAENATVALFEVQALLGSAFPGASHFPNPAGGPWTLVDVRVNLQAVVDFTRFASRKPIGTSVQEMTGDWRAYALRTPNRLRGGLHGSDVPTQALGRRLERIRGIEGFLSYSARVPT